MSVNEIRSKEIWDELLAQAKEAERPVVVDFTATWCSPCRIMSPYFEELSACFENIIFASVDVDEAESVAAECNITAMPTFMVFKDGEKVEELVGAHKDKLRALIEKYSK